MSTTVSMVLKNKGNHIVTVAPTQLVAAVVNTLSANRIGAVPVVEEGHLVGIISERDIVRELSEHSANALVFPAAQIMTKGVQTCGPGDLIVTLMETMTARRIRHLPVVENDVLIGMISIGDVVKQRLDEAQFELNELRNYIAS